MNRTENQEEMTVAQRFQVLESQVRLLTLEVDVILNLLKEVGCLKDKFRQEG